MGDQPPDSGKRIFAAGVSLFLICFELLRDILPAALPEIAQVFAPLPVGQPVLAFMLLLVLTAYAVEEYPVLTVVGEVCAGLIYLTFAAAVLAYLGGANLFAAVGGREAGAELAGVPSFAGLFSAVVLVRLRKRQDLNTPFHMVRVYVVICLAVYSLLLRVIPWPSSIEGVGDRGMSAFSAVLVLCVLAARVPVARHLSIARGYGVEIALAVTFVLSLYWLAGGLVFAGTVEKLLTLGWFALNSFALWKLGSVADQNRRLLAIKERQIVQLNEKRQKLRVLTHSLSHDLRSPIRNARTLHQYRDELRAEGEGGIKDVDARLTQNLDRAMALSEVFVRYLTLGDAPVRTEVLDLRQTLAPIAARFAGRVPVALGAMEDARIIAEREGFERVVENLLENALRHNPDTPSLEVRIEGGVLAGRRYRLRICDNGIGIPAEFRERVFQPFETLRPKSQTGSSGLGLAICQDLMARVDGAISVHDGAVGGACFDLDFVLAKEGAHVGSG